MPQDVGSMLDARSAGPAERVATALGRHGPAAVFCVVLIGAWVLLAGATTLLGLLVTHVLVGPLGLGGPDTEVVRALAADRTAALTAVSDVGEYVGGAPFLPALALLLAVGAAVKRHWLAAAFVVLLYAGAMATYRVASALAPRERPDVPRLERLDPDVSFPSGHVAGTVAVYCGIALLVTPRLRSRRVRIAMWALVAVLVVLVALSRLYRGMHHPLDVLAGIAVGAGAIVVLLIACRAARAAAGATSPRRRSAAHPRPVRLAATSQVKELH